MNNTERNWVIASLYLALTAHKDQVDKAGEPYILHVLRVGMSFKNPKLITLGFVHDTIEDSSLTADDLRANGLPEDVVQGAIAISKVKGESNEAYLARVEQNDLARNVKFKDLKDNSDLTRLKTITDKDRARTTKYLNSIARLSAFPTHLS